jgi:hypothetical protein
MSGNWVPILRQIPVGERLLANLVRAGWIERSPDTKTSDLYRITEAGRTAFKKGCLDQSEYVKYSACAVPIASISAATDAVLVIMHASCNS